MRKRRVFDDAFKLMAIELAEAKGSLSAAADELAWTQVVLARGERDLVSQIYVKSGMD